MLSTLALMMQLATAAAVPSLPCEFGAPVHPRPTPTAEARVLFELRLAPDTPTAAIDATLQPFLENQLPVVLLVPPAWTPDVPGWHPPANLVEVGVLANIHDLLGSKVADPNAVREADWKSALSATKRAVTSATGSRPSILASPPLPPTGEMMVEARGFTLMLIVDPSDASIPRRARVYGGRMGRTRVIFEGSSKDACGAQLGSPAPSALDRVTQVGPSQVVSRVALAPVPEQARAAALWWRDVAEPAGWKAWSARTAFIRLGTVQLIPQPSEEEPVTQAMVETARLLQAARHVGRVERLPRVLEGDLNLTEALVGLSALVAEPGHDRYMLPEVGPPAAMARTTLSGPVALDEAALRATAQEILPRLSTQTPGLFTIGAHTLTAGEYLVALASLARGESPETHPVGDPDPFAPGGGWGAVRVR